MARISFAASYTRISRRGKCVDRRVGARASIAASRDQDGTPCLWPLSYRSSKAALNAAFALGHPQLVAVLLQHGWVRTDVGGKQALLSLEESVAGMRRVIAGLAQADSGRFYNYDGSAIPW